MTHAQLGRLREAVNVLQMLIETETFLRSMVDDAGHRLAYATVTKLLVLKQLINSSLE